MSGREQHRDHRRLPPRHDDRLLGLGRIHHAAEVIGQRLDGRHVGGRKPVGEAGTAAVGNDQSAVGCQATEKARIRLTFPLKVEVRRRSGEQNEVTSAAGYHLVGK